jgi:putative Ig domain-containing protein
MMQSSYFCSCGALRRILVVLTSGAMWCSANIANAGQHWRDQLTISGSPAGSVQAGQGYAFTPSATDSAGRTLVFSISNKPSWASFSSSSGRLSGSPSAANAGTYSNIMIAVSDGWKNASLPAFAIQVVANTSTSTSSLPPPTISGTPPTSDVAGSVYSFQPSASGPSGMQLGFSVQNKPAWAAFSIATGLLSGTPGSTQTGTYSNIVVSVSDGVSSSSLAPFSITVTSATPTTGNATVNWQPPTQNTDGTALTNLAGMIIYYGTSPSSLNQTTQVAGTAQTSYTISNLAAGTWYFGGVAYTTSGMRSAMSSIVSANIP